MQSRSKLLQYAHEPIRVCVSHGETKRKSNMIVQKLDSRCARRKQATDGTAFLTPWQVAQRWGFHPESVRRLLRRGELESVIRGRRRLIPIPEVNRVEAEGRVARTA